MLGKFSLSSLLLQALLSRVQHTQLAAYKCVHDTDTMLMYKLGTVSQTDKQPQRALCVRGLARHIWKVASY